MVYDKQEDLYSNIKYIILIFYIKDRSIGFHLLIKILRTGYPFDAPELIEAIKKGSSKGRLNEIAAKLNEDSNPVIMLIKYKK